MKPILSAFLFRALLQKRGHIFQSVTVLMMSIVFVSGCQSSRMAGVWEKSATMAAKSNFPLQKSQGGVASFSEEVLKMQIFLDSKNFGPGLIDGRRGSFTEKVLQRYESLYGPVMLTDLQSIVPYTFYQIREGDLARIGNMAASPQQVALQRNQPYTELIAFIAERYHTSRAFLRQINPNVDLNQLHSGDFVQVPNVAVPFQIEAYPPVTRTPPDPTKKNRTVEVDTQSRLLRVLDSGKTLALFPITPGSQELPAPPGIWVIREIVAMPWYRYDKSMLNYGIRTNHFYMLPPGPRSPVGILWAGLNKRGIGIHGTNSPETIGRSASHGCIRLSNWDAARFRKLVTVGNTVTIR